MIKKNSDIFSGILFKELNKSLEICKFPSCLEMTNVTPVYKKGNRSDKDNYRRVSILPNLSNIFERCFCKQISTFFEDILSKYQCRFRKEHSAQHWLLALTEKWKKSVDHGKAFGALLTDLSKAFDCLPHSLFIAKLKDYGFDNNSLNLVNDYLSHRFQRTKIDNEHSSWKEIISGVPQGSILGRLFFNIHLCDLFFIIEKFDLANFADDNTPYVTGDNVSLVVKLLEEGACAIFQWFEDNEMKANADKCHVLLNTSNELTVKINEVQIKNSQSEKLLGITIDNDLKFEDHINNICRKASAKICFVKNSPIYGISEKKANNECIL